MKSIGILYIATGKYTIFWKEFVDSFERFFLPGVEKHYYVFTDAAQIYFEECNRIHKVYIKAEPWPLPTLMKYHYFLEIEDQLASHDYLYQSNGPILCLKEVSEEAFLPRDDHNEALMFTLHPGYYQKKMYLYPYDRNPKSKAYVPYNCGETYVFGAMNGGRSAEYIQFMKCMKNNIEDDLKKGIIAKYHDESHVNHYIIGKQNYRLLPFSYGYPSNMTVPGEQIITCLDKAKYLDIEEIKGKGDSQTKLLWDKYVNSPLCLCRDWLLRRKVVQ